MNMQMAQRSHPIRAFSIAIAFVLLVAGCFAISPSWADDQAVAATTAQDDTSSRPTIKSTLKKKASAKPGNAIAVSALILTGGSGWQHVPGKASKQEKRKIMPPNTKAWKGYRAAHKKVGLTIRQRSKYHAECSATVSLAVRLSGVDDAFSCETTAKQFQYMQRSPKWKEIGVWSRRTGEGVDLKPGDILVTEKCRNGKNGHIIIYIGNEIARNRYPYSNGIFVESAEGVCWPSVTTKDAAKKGYPKDSRTFVVFRTTRSKIPNSKFKNVLKSLKIQYSPE